MQIEPPYYQPVNHVFVDLENVKVIDHSLLGGKNLTLHLFFGPQNKKLDIDVVERLLENAQSVKMIRSPKSGKNALDFVLAYQLGQAVMVDPKGYFHIISKDTGFDALVDLLKSKHVKVKRHDDWSKLNFTSSPPKQPSVTLVEKTAPPAKKMSAAAEKVMECLKKSVKNRPKKEKTLLAHAQGIVGKSTSAAELTKVVNELRKASYLVIDDKGSVTYQL